MFFRTRECRRKKNGRRGSQPASHVDQVSTNRGHRQSRVFFCMTGREHKTGATVMRFKVWIFGFVAVCVLAAPATSLEFSGGSHVGYSYGCHHTHPNDLSSPACCGMAYGLVPGCCEFTPSWCDRIWDGYCQKKHVHMGWGRCHKHCGHRTGGVCRPQCAKCSGVCVNRP